MDFYGKCTALRLSEIEKSLSPMTDIGMSQYTKFIGNYKLLEEEDLVSKKSPKYFYLEYIKQPIEVILNFIFSFFTTKTYKPEKEDNYKNTTLLIKPASVSRSVKRFGILFFIICIMILIFSPALKTGKSSEILLKSNDLNLKIDKFEIDKINKRLNNIDAKIDLIIKNRNLSPTNTTKK